MHRDAYDFPDAVAAFHVARLFFAMILIPKHIAAVALIAAAPVISASPPPAALEWAVAAQDVVWDSPSADARGSMPLGNGDIGLNVWVEPAGDLVLLVAKTDSFDEFNRLLKIGRIRVRTTPALVQPGQPFSQALRLADGAIEIHSGEVSIRVWVDANQPLAQVDVQSKTPVTVQVMADNWRKENRVLTNEGPGANTAWGNRPDKMCVNADTVLTRSNGQIGWCHHNVESQWKANLELTALGAEVANGKDPVLNRSFGALVRATGATAVSDTELKSAAPTTAFTAQILTLTEFFDSPQAWQQAAAAKFDAVAKLASAGRFAEHQAWWHAFWNRSWIQVETAAGALVPVNAHSWKVGMDSSGATRFGGEIAGARILNTALNAADIAAMATAPRPVASNTIEGAELKLTDACTLAAWIKPTAGEIGRILDKCTPGKPDGLTFDCSPGLALRWIAGAQTMQLPACLKAGEWQHVVATLEGNGKQAVYLDGRLLKEERPADPAAAVTRAYTLQRFVTACSGRGALPIKFNGSLFTVEGKDPDFRSWGGGYWFQNTREAYWAMLSAGDYDMMPPLFSMYRKALPLREAATLAYYKHQGAFFPETMYFWGNYMDVDNYGLDRKGKPDGLADNTFIRYYWQSGLELLAMMLDYFDGTQEVTFRDQTLLPLAKSIVTFYDQHWSRGPDGKILFDPAQALETWHVVKNPTPEIVGLRYVINRLMNLPVDTTTHAQWEKILRDLPAVPMTTAADGKRLLPAETFSNKSNIENPELYAVFPYRSFTYQAGGENLQIGRTTWNHRIHKEDHGWQQNSIQAALLGLADEAKAGVTSRALSTAGYRFPGFFGPNYDWTPEQCHGTNMMTALQRMILQCEGDQILLLPAWPKDWKASFKLHAPRQTTVQGRIENGRVVDLNVIPESRKPRQ
jgi:hypothetical protein